jgi:L-arabinose isomerase
MFGEIHRMNGQNNEVIVGYWFCKGKKELKKVGKWKKKRGSENYNHKPMNKWEIWKG